MPEMRTIKVLHKLIFIIPFYLFFMGLLILLAIDVEHLENVYLARIILSLLLLYATAHLFRALIFAFGRWVVATTTRNFTPERQFNRYLECKPNTHCAGKKRDHLVLLLHGFTTSPMEWELLAERLRTENIDFHAPLMYGFGQINHDVMLAIHKEDWFRQVTDLYDLFAEQYEKISVVGHSMGGMLACYLAQTRSVHELIISAPALFPQKKQGFYARVVKSQLATRIVSWCIPMIPKPSRKDRSGPADTMDGEATYRNFQYLVAPVRLLIAMLESQVDIDLRKIRCRRLTLLYGQHDITVVNAAMEHFIESAGLPFQSICLKKSAHNIFIDFDRLHANDLVISLLNDSFRGTSTDFYDYKTFNAFSGEIEK